MRASAAVTRSDGTGHLYPASAPDDSFGRAEFAHGWATAGVCLAVALVCWVAGPLPLGPQVLGLAVGVAAVGLPHGALDHRTGRALLAGRAGGRWWAWFFGAYLVVAAAVVTGWVVVPVATAVAFFAVAATHFGADDAEQELWPRAWRPLAIPVLGLMPVALPAYFHPAEIAGLLAAVAPGGSAVGSAEVVERSAAWIGLAVLAGAGAAVAHHLQQALWTRSGRQFRAGVRTAAFVLLFAATPPLVGFVVYFCGWHSVRNLIALGRQAGPRNLTRGLARVAVTAAPLTLAALLLVLAAAVWPAGRPATEAAVRAVFVGLSAVAVPHVLLELVAERARVGPFTDVPSAGGTGGV